MENIITKLSEYKIIPVIAIEAENKALKLADALIEGGLPVIEITFRTDEAPHVIALLKKERPELIIGAGTILSIIDVTRAKDNGAEFAVSPGINPDIIKKAAEIGLPFFPGIATPSDIEHAMSLGCNIMKFFPSEALGGIKYLNSMSAPYKHTGIKFIPTGGINSQNLSSYLEQPNIIACGGTWIANRNDIESGNWSDISRKCIESKKIANMCS